MVKKKPSAIELLNRNKGKGCGECKFFADENADGTGLCILRKMPLVKYCGDKACAWFKERESNRCNFRYSRSY